MDFIFGTWATDELKIAHHRANWRGLQHQHAIEPRDPGPDVPVTLTVRTGPDLAVDHMVCYFTTDGSVPRGSQGRAQNGQIILLERVETAWDSLVWGYVTRWQGVVPAQPEGTAVNYQIGAWAEGGDHARDEMFADWPDANATAEAAAAAFFNDRELPDPLAQPNMRHTFVYHVDTLAAPEWAREAIIYHVFIDRFYPGDGKDWLQTDDLNGFCGGTLWGVHDKMDYITDLGANCIWLSPLWPSESHHGYDATDYTTVEPRLGGDAALRAVVEAAHARGIRVLLDLVCNHISNEHPFFVEAYTNPQSGCRDWFTFDDSEIGYRSFFGSPNMPQINLDHPAARAWMLDIARFWLREFDVDGYRLDYATGPGADFWPDFWTACKAEKPDSFCFGEIVDAPDVLRTYEGRLDGCLDFQVGEALRNTYGWQTWTEADLDRFLAHHKHYFAPEFVIPTFIDNHDMDRFLFIAAGDKKALRRAAARQMKLDGPPIIYYGTEVGLSQLVSTGNGNGLHVSRTPMLWDDEQDKDLLAYYQRLIQQRKETIHQGGSING